MPVQIACRCQKVLTFSDGFAGQRVNCPNCGMVLDLPAVPASPRQPKSLPRLGKPAGPRPTNGHEPKAAPFAAPRKKGGSQAPLILTALLGVVVLAGGIVYVLVGRGTADPGPNEEEKQPGAPVALHRPVKAVGSADGSDSADFGAEAADSILPEDLGQIPIPALFRQETNSGPKAAGAAQAKTDLTEEERYSMLRALAKEKEQDADARRKKLEALRAKVKAQEVQMKGVEEHRQLLLRELPPDAIKAAKRRMEQDDQRSAEDRAGAGKDRQRRLDELRAANLHKAEELVRVGKQRMGERRYSDAADSFARARILVPEDDDVTNLLREARKFEKREEEIGVQEYLDRQKVNLKKATLGKAAYEDENERMRERNLDWLSDIAEAGRRSDVVGKDADASMRSQTGRSGAAGGAKMANLGAEGGRAGRANAEQWGAMRVQGDRAGGAMRGAREAFMAEGARMRFAAAGQMVNFRFQGDRAAAAGRDHAANMRAQGELQAFAGRQQAAAERAQGMRMATNAREQLDNMREQGARAVVAGAQQKANMNAQTEQYRNAVRVQQANEHAVGERNAIWGRDQNRNMRAQTDRVAAAGQAWAVDTRSQTGRSEAAGRMATATATAQGGRGGGRDDWDAQNKRIGDAGRDWNEGQKDRPPQPVASGNAAPAPLPRPQRKLPPDLKERLKEIDNLEEKQKQDAANRQVEEQRKADTKKFETQVATATQDEKEIRDLEAKLARAEQSEKEVDAMSKVKRDRDTVKSGAVGSK